MAQLAVSIAGAAIGSMFGPLGMQIGWAAGSLIGGALFAEGQQGPRISDTRVQVSSYGASIALPYGGVRLAGNVIWSTDLQEHESDSGGKGGPSVTTYSYSVSCAVAIADRPIGGIRRIWADALLVYDAREDASAETQATSAAFAEHMTVYLGTESQLPDPTIEAAEGAGSVEAYRGVAYVVFADLPLGEYGNRVPNFSFEVTSEDPETGSNETLAPHGIPPWWFDPVTGMPTGMPAGDADAPMEFAVDTPTGVVGTFSSLSAAMAAAVARAEYLAGSGNKHGNPSSTEYIAYFSGTNDTPSVFAGGATLDDDPEYVYLIFVPAQIGGVTISDAGTSDSYVGCGAAAAAGLGPYSDTVIFTPGSWNSTNGNGGLVSMAGFNGATFINACFLTWPDIGPPVPTAYRAEANVIRAKRLPRCDAKICAPGNPCASESGLAELPGNPDFCISCDGTLSGNAEYLEHAGTYKQLTLDEWSGSGVSRHRTRPAQGPVVAAADPRYTDEDFWQAAALASAHGVPGPYSSTGLEDGKFPHVVATVCRAESDFVEVAAGSALLADIVSDICLRAGLEAGDINVTQLIDEVQGFVVTRQMPARAALTPLLQAHYVDAVDTGDKLLFVKRGAAAVAAIGPDDLGASEAEEAVVLVESTRAQETELPNEVSVGYMVREADYQTGVQQARRATGASQQVTGVEFPIVMSDTRAAEVADVIMVDAWQGRIRRSFRTLRTWAQLLPTDVITLDDGQFQYRGRLTEKIEDGQVIHWTLREDAAATYSPSVTASPTSGGGGVVTFVGPVAVELMDIPALRDADDNAGFYAAAYAAAGRFRGGMLHVSPDDSAFEALQELRVSAAVGLATTLLAPHGGGNTFDEANAVTVTMRTGTLASVSRAQVLNGANAAVLGDEVIQFRDATLIAPNTYLVSGLLRGRRGTEAQMAAHAVGERFVLLNERNIYRIARSLPQIGTDYYRAVTNGQALADAPSIQFTNTAAALRPLSPVHLSATPAGASLALHWVRRTRIGGAWMNGIDVPLSEASESYRVRVLDGDGAVLEEQFVSTPAATVVDDPAATTVEVAQMSASIGAGFPATLEL